MVNESQHNLIKQRPVLIAPYVSLILSLAVGGVAFGQQSRKSGWIPTMSERKLPDAANAFVAPQARDGDPRFSGAGNGDVCVLRELQLKADRPIMGLTLADSDAELVRRGEDCEPRLEYQRMARNMIEEAQRGKIKPSPSAGMILEGLAQAFQAYGQGMSRGVRSATGQLADGSESCTSASSCGVGKVCARKPGSPRGVCMTAVDEHGVRSFAPGLQQQHALQCNTLSDCPVGFACDSSFKVCVKK